MQMDNDPKYIAETTQDFLKANKSSIFKRQSQSPDFNPAEHVSQVLKTKLKAERLTTKQQLSVGAAKVWKSISREEALW